jgi:hypothetical protein
MNRFAIEDILVIGEAAGDHTALYARLGEMLGNSTDIRADVQSLNMETGAYRIVLRGTLVNRPPADLPHDRPEAGESSGRRESWRGRDVRGPIPA